MIIVYTANIIKHYKPLQILGAFCYQWVFD